MDRATKKKRAQPLVRALPRLDRLSSVAENYLLALYILLEEEQVRATLGHLAEFLRQFPESEDLGTSLPSVAGMLRRMAREGLVEVTPTKDFRLTSRGMLLAEDMVRRHRLAERMVVDLLGMELHRAHIEAHRLEHAISPEMQSKIAERLGNPKTCPFGRPIPGSGYRPDTQAAISLDQARPGTSYVIDRIPEEDQELLRFLVEHHLIPERRVVVEEAAPYRGILTLRVNQEPVSLGYEVASRIWVHPIDR